MKNIEDIRDFLNLLTPQLSLIKHIEKIILFGSYAKGVATIKSDVDIAIINSFDGTSMKLKHAVTRALDSVYDGDLEISFTFVHLENYLNDNHALHVSSSIKKEGIILWQR